MTATSVSFPARIYGRYLGELLQSHRAERSPHQRLRLVHGECASLRPTRLGVEVKLAEGSSVVGHIAVLATGNEAPPKSLRGVRREPVAEPLNPASRPMTQ